MINVLNSYLHQSLTNFFHPLTALHGQQFTRKVIIKRQIVCTDASALWALFTDDWIMTSGKHRLLSFMKEMSLFVESIKFIGLSPLI